VKTGLGLIRRYPRTASLICVVVVAAVVTAALRWQETSWGDAPTWLTFIAAAFGIPFALFQFNMQRTQLREQQTEIDAGRKRQELQDKLLSFQLQQAEGSVAVLK
jgi:hypothetical protein